MVCCLKVLWACWLSQLPNVLLVSLRTRLLVGVGTAGVQMTRLIGGFENPKGYPNSEVR